MSDVLEYVSVFSGAGGLDVGFDQAGWRCLFATDHDDACIATLRANQGRGAIRATTAIERWDVRDLDAGHVLEVTGRNRGEIPLLVGGPPCQSWSSAGHQRGFEDPRGQLFADYVRLARDLGCRWLVFENVRGLLTAVGPDGRPGGALEHIRRSLLDAGFQTAVHVLNAADYGVPQRRVRLFIMGFAMGSAPPAPSPTHAEVPLPLLQDLAPWVSLRVALESAPPVGEEEVIRPSAQLAAQLAVLRPGSGVKSPGKAERTRPGGHWGYKQGAFLLDPDVPARTVTASTQQDWMREPDQRYRRLTPRECAILQTFPPGWELVGGATSRYRQVGNAVPPLLARAIAASLASHVASTGARHSAVGAANGMGGDLIPLLPGLSRAVANTAWEHAVNGPSRRMAPDRRAVRKGARRTRLGRRLATIAERAGRPRSRAAGSEARRWPRSGIATIVRS